PSSQRFTWTEYADLPDPTDPMHHHLQDYEVVFDNLTHLLWQRRLRDPASPLLNWDQANDYCNTLSIRGYPSGWRLPTRIELASLVDYSVDVDGDPGPPVIPPMPSIDTTVFPWPSNQSSFFETFWSASSAAGIVPDQAWAVGFNGGAIFRDL